VTEMGVKKEGNGYSGATGVQGVSCGYNCGLRRCDTLFDLFLDIRDVVVMEIESTEKREENVMCTEAYMQKVNNRNPF